MRSSAVCTWRCVPTTALTRPSRYQPIACDSLVASQCMSTRMMGVSRCSSGRISSALRNGQSIGFMNTRPIRFSTATRCGPHLIVTWPTPGVPAGKLAGRSNRLSLVMNSTISFLSQMWLPDVSTSAPCSSICFAMGPVTPKPPAAFSQFTTQKSMACSSRSRGSSLASAVRPGSPKMSPTISTFMPLLRHLDRAGLADHHDLDVPGVLHLRLDPLGDVLGELVCVEVGHDIGARHHAQLAAGLDGVAHVDAFVRQRDLLELRQPLDVGLEHVAPRAGPRR